MRSSLNSILMSNKYYSKVVADYFTEHYDTAKKMCCSEFLCGKYNFKTLSSPVSEQIQFLDLIKQLPFKASFTLFFFLVAVISTLVYWNKIDFKIELKNKKTHKMLTLKIFSLYLNTPRAFSAVIISTWYAFIFLTFDQILGSMWPSPNQANFSDFIALSIAGTAVLFPLVILIMDGNKNDHPGVFPSAEVLLRHAYAFPISVTLLTTLALSAFRMNYYWMRLVVVISVFLSALALLRLLHVIFGPKAWKKTEEKLLQTHAQDAIKEIARQRLGYISTNKAINELSPAVTSYHSSFKKEEYSEKRIKAGKIGRIQKIDFKTINLIIRKLASNDEDANEQNPDSVATEESKPKIANNFEIVLRAHVEEIVERPDEIVIIFKYDKATYNENAINRIVVELSKIVVIDNLVETDMSIELLDTLFSRIRLLGMESIDKNNEALANRISSTYLFFVESILDSFQQLEIKYSLNSAKQETTLFGNDWKPLTKMFENIRDWTEYLLKKNDVNNSVSASVIYTPYRLAITSYLKRDIYTFVNSVRIAIVQQQVNSKNGDIVSYEWIKSLVDYTLGRDLEEVSEIDESKVIIEYLRAVFEVELIIAKESVDSGVKGTFDSAIDLFYLHPKLFKYDDLESEIMLKEYLILRMTDSEKVSAEIILQSLRSKLKLKERVENWRKEMLAGLGAYCLMQIDGLGKQLDNPPSKEFLVDSFLTILNYLPKDFIEIIKLRVSMNHQDVSERWGWEWWERMESGEAKFMSFSLYLDQMFNFLFLNSITDKISHEKLDNLKLYDKDVFDFREEPQALRGKIDSTNQRMREFGLVEKDEAEIKKIREAFDHICITAKTNSDLRLVDKKLSQNGINNFNSGFVKSFQKTTRFRKIFSFRTQVKDSIKDSIKDRLKWGINLLMQREYFIDDPEYNHLSLGEHYGSDLGRSEEIWLFQRIARKSVSADAKTISELIQMALEVGFNLETLIILTSRNIYSMKKLRADPLFKYPNQVANKTFDGKADGFIEWGKLNIPIISVSLKPKEAKGLPNLILLDKDSIEIIASVDSSNDNRLNSLGFTFQLVDPLEETNDGRKLKTDLLNKNPEWLSKTPDHLKIKLVGKLVWVRILEDIEVYVKMNKYPLGVKYTSSKDDEEEL